MRLFALLIATATLVSSTATSDDVENQINNLKDKDQIVRFEAIIALSELNDSRAVEPLIRAHNEEDKSTKEVILRTLGRFRDQRAVDALVHALDDKDLRTSAAFALGEQNDSRAVEPLIQILSDGGKSSRSTAARILGEMRDPRAVEPLTQALKDEDRAVQEEAELALEKYGNLTNQIARAMETDEEGNPFWSIFKLKPFQFRHWGGRYFMADLNGTRYFAAYDHEPISNEIPPVPFLYQESKEINLTAKGYLSEVLIDDHNDTAITSSQPLRLKGGYELLLKSIDEFKANLELRKYGQIIDSKLVAPSISNPTLADQTYYYRRNVGDTQDIVIIAAHFKDSYKSDGMNTAIVDGIFQISDVPMSLEDLAKRIR